MFIKGQKWGNEKLGALRVPIAERLQYQSVFNLTVAYTINDKLWRIGTKANKVNGILDEMELNDVRISVH